MGKILLKNGEEDKVAGKHTRRKTEPGWRNGGEKKKTNKQKKNETTQDQWSSILRYSTNKACLSLCWGTRVGANRTHGRWRSRLQSALRNEGTR